MICQLGGFVAQRHNELRDLEAELLSTACNDAETEPVPQDIFGERLNARLDIQTRGFWEHQRSVIFDVRACHPKAESCKDLEPQQVYRMHENEKNVCIQENVLDIEQNINALGIYNNRR